ncbi:TPA: hypothetical protein ACGOON_000947 [Streptococcus suis]
MKKILGVIALVSCAWLLVACGSNTSSEWLEGDWKSEEWSVTYSIEEENGVWTIADGQYLLAEHVTLTQDGQELVLEDQDGTQFQIKKIDESHIYFQQVAAEGVQGTTASVEFTKIDE